MLITNGKIITWDEPNQILEGQAMRVNDDRIAEIGPHDRLISDNPGMENLLKIIFSAISEITAHNGVFLI